LGDVLKQHNLKKCECIQEQGVNCFYIKKILNLKLTNKDKENEKPNGFMNKIKIFRKYSSPDILSSSE